MSKKAPKIDNITRYHSFLIGLLGHVDSGKTAIARHLTEIVSTSGLDAHPQSKERGITIDLGFTSFIEDDLIVTLVDAPGHADLIRSVVASARIIDGAVIVIDGKEGIQVQTAEHLVILELLGISNVLFVINKIDIVPPDKIQNVKDQLKLLLKNTIFTENRPVMEVSAKTGKGISELKRGMAKWIQQIPKVSYDSAFSAFPIDHHFQKKGIGVIVTGTTRGSISVGDTLTVIPHFSDVKIKNAQVYYQNVSQIPHGFRGGLVLSAIDASQLQRGDILTNTPSQYEKAELIEVEFSFSRHFQKSIAFGSQIHVTLGMVTTNARIFPFYFTSSEKRVMAEEVNYPKIQDWSKKSTKFGAFLWFQQPQFTLHDEILIFSQLDLPPSTLRFFGSGKIHKVMDQNHPPVVHYIKIKTGKIKNPRYSDTTVLVEGLAQSKEGAQTLVNKQLEPPFGKITAIFGGKGVIIAEKPSNYSCSVGDLVYLKAIRSLKILKEKSYTQN